MDYKEFFLTNNASGWKTRENLLQRKEPEVYSKLKEYINSNNLSELPFKQQVWHFINNESNPMKCIKCGKPVRFRDTLNKGYHEFCNLECANKSELLQERATKKIKEKYGVDAFPLHKSFVKKVKKSKLQNYGNENYNNFAKSMTTKERLYGDKFYSNKNKNSITTRANFLIRIQEKTPDKVIKYKIGDPNITLNCAVCGLDYEIYNTMFNSRTSLNIKTCTLCNPISSGENIQQKELFQFIQQLLPNEIIEFENRKLIKPFEVDIYIPSRKLAIEFDGIYWHSDKFEHDSHLLEKTNMTQLKDVELIHIFEDEWIYKREIVKSILKTKLGIIDRRIYARKCEIREVSNILAEDFLNQNHLQGSVNSKIRYGLYFNNELVSLMTFGGLRKSLGSSAEEGCYELVRYAGLLNSSVIGGFSRLLKHFIKIYRPKSILTYSDKRYFTGEIYQNNGFSYVKDTKPNYFYIFKQRREYRFKYRKDILVKQGFDSNKTEREIMSERGINRIYDCGNKKWLLNL